MKLQRAQPDLPEFGRWLGWVIGTFLFSWMQPLARLLQFFGTQKGVTVVIAYFVCAAASAPLVLWFLEAIPVDTRLAIGVIGLMVFLPWALCAAYIFGYMAVVILCILLMVVQVLCGGSRKEGSKPCSSSQLFLGECSAADHACMLMRHSVI